jgi:hypothetical protein
MGAAAGPARAATPGQAVTACDTGSSGLLALNVFPTCTAGDSTVLYPTSLTVTAVPSFFSTLGALPGVNALLALLGQSLTENVSYTLTCSVDGKAAVYNGSSTATAGSQTQAVDLQSAVGSPEPNSCTLSGLSATSLVSLSTPLLVLLGGTHFDFGVSATATTAVPGALWRSSGKTAAHVNADICVDDAGNGNAGSIVQAWQCNSDLAQYWTWTAGAQLVRNGDCLAMSGGKAVLAACDGSTAQQWQVKGTGGHFDSIVNAGGGECLTAPSALNGTQLTLAGCTGGADQAWTGPPQSVV